MVVLQDLQLQHLDYSQRKVSQVVVYVLVVKLRFEVEFTLTYREDVLYVGYRNLEVRTADLEDSLCEPEQVES